MSQAASFSSRRHVDLCRQSSAICPAPGGFAQAVPTGP
ncbi:putative leader peptide [Longispora sp. NPDC051575]